MTPAEYADIYRRMPRIQEGTDNSDACIRRLVELLLPGSVCDVGCGTGHLLSVLAANSGDTPRKFTGVDFQLDPGISQRHPGIEFREADLESLPFPDRAFDTVICTHVLEHVLRIDRTIVELRRIAARRLLIIVPL